MKVGKKIFFMVAVCLLFAMLYQAACLQPQTAQEMPTLIIELADGDGFAQKEFVHTTLSVSYPGQMKDVVLDADTRYRGNGTMDYDKKSYKIELEKQYDLFLGEGSGEENLARDWVLLANYFDLSSLRNYTMLTIAKQLDGLDFVSDCMFVELYLVDENGEEAYQGVYLLCEETEVNKARVDINDVTAGEKGFLLELTKTPKQEDRFTVEHGDTTLTYDICSQVDSPADVKRMQQVVETAVAAVATGDESQIEAVLDLDSCIDMYLLQEYMMNIDVGWGSFYFYCNAGEEKLYFAPPWDFDHAAGADWRLLFASFKGLYVGSAQDILPQNNQWYQDLMQLDWFQRRVVERWNQKKDVFASGISNLQTVRKIYAKPLQTDYILWHAGQEIPEYGVASGVEYEKEVVYLSNWLQDRYLWLDNYFNNRQ